MDVNADGVLDILSGSYSRQDKDMAGLFQVLHGKKGGTFGKAQVLDGSDGKPLILPRTENVTDRICTRAFAADLDGDGALDLVAGNFAGTFALFRGEGGGKFAPEATWLQAGGEAMAVDMHSDPMLVDWDKDGDLDLVSGSAQGGAFLFVNEGSAKQPKFAAKQTLLEPVGHAPAEDEPPKFGDAHRKAPDSSTRVWVDDVDGDGKLDLLVGDQLTLLHLAKGEDEAGARTKLAAWQKKQQAFLEEPTAESEEGRKKWLAQYKALEEERDAFARQEMTGFVWLLRQK